jgi:BioD-like phosphotransacetylase family protein
MDPSIEPLLSPENNSTPRVFVAATRQNDGKTTTCLGLFAALQIAYKKVGYIKPIGQRFIDIEGLMIDEDSYLFERTYKMETPIEAMSPVAIDATFTRRYLDDPVKTHPKLVNRIVCAFDRAAYEKDVIIIEGSGHAGVGAICDLSNAEVAKLLGAKAIIVSRGGIGRPVDEIALNKSLFDKHGVEVIGAILNKVQPDKMDLVRKYTGKALQRMGVPLLGLIPEQQQLSLPNMNQIVETVNGRWLNAQKSGRYNRVTQVVVGAMTAQGLMEYIKPGILIITPGDREDVLLLAIAASAIAGKRVLSGILLTRNILPSPHLMEMLSQTDIPVVICNDESYQVASNVHSMTVKTQPEDNDKIPLIKKLITENVAIDKLVDYLKG